MARYNNYSDYITAAQRHLLTCDYLVKCLKLPDNLSHKPLNSGYRNHILRNIYYLSGYTIECIVNYAIYQSVNDSRPRHNRITMVNQLYEPSLSLVYKDRSRGGFQYVIAWHNFQENMKVLNILATAKFASIPVIGQRIYPANWSSLSNLFDNWKPQVRYTNISFSEDDIIEFYNLSAAIYTNVRSCITT